MNSNGSQPMKTPEELRRIESAMDALGRAERESAPATLEHGIFEASRHAVDAGDEPVIARIHTRPLFGRTLRIAAAVALAGVAVVIWSMNGNGTSGTPSTLVASNNGLEEDVNFLLDLSSSADDLALLGERIDSLYLDTTSVSDSLKSDPGSVLLGDGAL